MMRFTKFSTVLGLASGILATGFALPASAIVFTLDTPLNVNVPQLIDFAPNSTVDFSFTVPTGGSDSLTFSGIPYGDTLSIKNYDAGSLFVASSVTTQSSVSYAVDFGLYGPGSYQVDATLTAPLDPPITVSLSSGVPEPSTWAMMLIGLASLGIVAHRRAKAEGDALIGA